MKVMKIKFGESGERVDAFGVRFYGDIDGDGRRFGRVSEIFPGQEPLSSIKNKRITIWFTFMEIRSYENVSAFLDRLVAKLRSAGYEIIFSSIDDLVDTTSAEYEGLRESMFPESMRIHGYNGAGGFSATAEKSDGKSAFSMKEIEMMQSMASQFGEFVYGRHLEKSK
jgi:hypothetical protein